MPKFQSRIGLSDQRAEQRLVHSRFVPTKSLNPLLIIVAGLVWASVAWRIFS